MCAGIHLYLYLPAIYAYAYTYTNSASAVANRDCYFDCNCHGDFYSYFHPNYHSTTNSDIYAYGNLDDYTQANAYAEAGYNAERTTHSAAAPVVRNHGHRSSDFGAGRGRRPLLKFVEAFNHFLHAADHQRKPVVIQLVMRVARRMVVRITERRGVGDHDARITTPPERPLV